MEMLAFTQRAVVPTASGLQLELTWQRKHSDCILFAFQSLFAVILIIEPYFHIGVYPKAAGSPDDKIRNMEIRVALK